MPLATGNLFTTSCVKSLRFLKNMVCSNCGYSAGRHERFCRQCGTLVANLELVAGDSDKNLISASLKDPDELTGNGIGKVIVGDGFLMVAVFLSVTNSAISSLLWLLLLIPA